MTKNKTKLIAGSDVQLYVDGLPITSFYGDIAIPNGYKLAPKASELAEPHQDMTDKVYSSFISNKSFTVNFSCTDEEALLNFDSFINKALEAQREWCNEAAIALGEWMLNALSQLGAESLQEAYPKGLAIITTRVMEYDPLTCGRHSNQYQVSICDRYTGAIYASIQVPKEVAKKLGLCKRN